MGFIKSILTRFFVMLGVLTFIIIVCAVIIVKSLADMKKEVADNSVLFLNTSSIMGDVSTESSFFYFDSFFGNKVSLVDTLIVIRKAASDPKITGIFADLSEIPLSYAQVEELRNELALFKKSGKPVYVWSDTFGEISNGTKNYYLASVFDKIYLQPSGMLGLNGLSSESMFFKNMLEKLKIEPIGSHRKEYKTYWNMFSEDKYTKEHKESAESLINSIFSKITADISASRDLPVEKITGISDSFTLTSADALKAGLVDGIKYKDEAVEEFKNFIKYEKTISVSSYYKISHSEFEISAKSKIAVIELPGSIHRGISDMGPSGNLQSTGSITAVSLLKKAWKDDNVKGVLIRVNSPGGSVIASESIWNQIGIMVKENKKPVVVSMGTVAASGGYYVSMPAEKIFADHNTITGSIGVVLGKMYTREFFNWMGITFDTVKTGKNTDLFSPLTRLEKDQSDYLEKSLDDIYNSFVTRAAENRKMEAAELEKHAKGRVWTGALAKEKGLVDEIGGFMDALEYIKTKSSCEADIAISKYPEPDKFWEMLTGSEDDSPGIIRYFENVFSFFTTFFKNINYIQREIKVQQQESFQLKGDVEIR
jgi:protease IV